MKNAAFQESPYFIQTQDSLTVPLKDLVARENPEPLRLERARQLMLAAGAGLGEKRKPMDVVPMADGRYRVVDGNTTLHVLRELDEDRAVIRIRPEFNALHPSLCAGRL